MYSCSSSIIMLGFCYTCLPIYLRILYYYQNVYNIVIIRRRRRRCCAYTQSYNSSRQNSIIQISFAFVADVICAHNASQNVLPHIDIRTREHLYRTIYIYIQTTVYIIIMYSLYIIINVVILCVSRRFNCAGNSSSTLLQCISLQLLVCAPSDPVTDLCIYIGMSDPIQLYKRMRLQQQ